MSSALLSPLFTLSGKVIHGEKVGRQIGFPTVNIDQLPLGATPKGVYAGTCSIAGKTYDCLAYFGPRLIFGEEKDSFEAYIYEFNQEVYDQIVDFRLLNFIRSPLPFTTLSALQAQLKDDKIKGLQALQDRHATEK